MQFNEFSSHFVEIVSSLLEPLSEVAHAIQEESDSEPEVLEDLYNSFLVIGICMCGADSRLNIAEAEVLSNLEQLFPDKSYTSPEIMHTALGNQSAEQWESMDSLARLKPRPLRFLEVYDNAYGTDLADALRHLYLAFAVIMANADGTFQEDESDFLEELKNVLYESDCSTSSSEDVIPPESLQIAGRPVEDALIELDGLVGLAPVKLEVGNLVNLLKVNGIRKERGLPVLQASNHLVFYGNPGTGKTTIARLVAEIYKGLEVLTKGHLIETDRSGLVAGYLGQTAIKVKEVVESALGGVLFIDEAYTLSQEGNDSYGKEAIDTLLKLMEDHRHDLVVIVAGYPRKMAAFLESNPGLQSRFNRHLDFPDYSPLELQLVFEGMIKNAGLVLSGKAAAKSMQIFTSALNSKDESFGNGRFARNLFDSSVAKQANRLITLSHIDDEALRTLKVADIKAPDRSILPLALAANC